jgi:hypothetical protein
MSIGATADARPKFYSRSHDAVIRVYDETGNVIDTHEHASQFKRKHGRWPYGFDKLAQAHGGQETT